MLRRSLFKTLAVLFLIAAGLPPVAHADPSQDPQTFISALAEQAITTIADKRLSDAERSDRFRRLFVSAFDQPEIAKFVLGRYWRTATPEQQQQFLKLFEDLNVLTWSRRFKEYNGEKLQTLGETRDGDRGWVVDSRLMRDPTPPLPVQWRLRQADDGKLKVIDIVVEGVSMALTQRSDYSSSLQSNGGKLDALFSNLQTKIDQMRAEP